MKKALLKTPISYYGGKTTMLPTLLNEVPPHKTYVEPFVGGGSLFFAKAKSTVEVLNDLNGYVAAFYRTIKNNFEQLDRMIQETLCDEHTYKKCRVQYRERGVDLSDLEKAYVLWVGANMSFGGSVYDGTFAITTNSHDRCSPATKLNEKKKRFKDIAGRLETTIILEKDAVEVIKKYNNKDVFIYADPPYLGARQGHYRGYKLDQFLSLLDEASKSKSKILISCYWHDCIKDFDFIIDKKDVKTKVISTNKTEILLRNYKISHTLFDF